jgi:hypothetical protein
LVGKPERKKSVGKPRRKLKNNIHMDLRKNVTREFGLGLSRSEKRLVVGFWLDRK